MTSFLTKSLIVLSVASSFGISPLVANAATGGESTSHSYSEAARDLGISEKDFNSQLQQAANTSSTRPSSRATNYERVHFEFRTFNAYDSTYRIPKQTKSAYHLKSNTVNRPWYSAEAWGHSFKAGRTGNVSVSGPRVDDHNIYQIKANKRYKLTNYLVERYGPGNNAYIMAWSHGDGNAWGYWNPDSQV